VNLDIRTTPIGPQPTIPSQVLESREGATFDPALAPAFLAFDAAEQSLDELVSGRALCVTTGQQPGLLTGPLLTLYKALTAVAVADRLAAQLRRPVVPVFWVAGDDHDFAEVNHATVLTTANAIEHLVLRDRQPDAPLAPMYREILGPDVETVLARLAEVTPDTEFKTDVLGWLGRHYRADTDLAEAFAGALAELFGRFGMVVFRPTHAAAKRAFAPQLVRALRDADTLDDALAARSAELERVGRTGPVAISPGATTVMIEARSGRDRLMRDGADFVTRRSGERWSLRELEAVAESDPTRLSANVLLRPVIEATVLPTLAYVGGPAELSYLPQADPIYATFRIAPQARVARWSGRVVESRVAKVLAKFDVEVEELNAPEGQLEGRLVRGGLPNDAADALTALRATLQREFERLTRTAEQLDPTLKKPIQSAGQGALRSVGDVEKRLISHLKKQNDIIVQQLDKARRNLFPGGRPQERTLNGLPFLIRYGNAFLDAGYARCQEWTRALETSPREA
jgi:bacillithiol biosynthesis cysteine-adding enzyme BshC